MSQDLNLPHSHLTVQIHNVVPPIDVGDRLRAVLAEVPGLGALAAWYEQDQAAAAWRRIREVLLDIDARVGAMESAGVPIQTDQEWAELVANTIPHVARI